MIQRISLFIFCIFFLYGPASYSQCIEDNIAENYERAIKNLKNRERQSSLILEGNYRVELSFIELFGSEYQFQDTKTEIKKLSNLSLNEVIQRSDHTSLVECLSALKDQSKYLQITSQLTDLKNLKIKILKENLRLNDALRDGLTSRGKIPSLQDDIVKENKASQNIKNSLEKDLLNSQSNLNEKSFLEREIISFRNSLIKIKIELLKNKLENNKVLQDRLVYFEQMSEKLTQISSGHDFSSQESTQQKFEQIESLWFSISRENFFQLFKFKFNFKLPIINSIPQDVLKGADKKLINDLKQELAVARSLKLDTIAELTDKKEQELKLLNELFLQTNSVKSTFYGHVKASYIIKKVFSPSSFKYIRQEVLASPYRIISFFYKKYFYIHEKVLNGRDGILELTRDLFKYLFIFFVFWFITFIVSKLKKFLDKLQSLLIRKHSASTLTKILSSLWNKYKDSTVSLIYVVFIHQASSLTTFKDYKYVLDVMLILAISKILRSLIIIFLGSVSKIDMKNFFSFKKRANETAQKFSKIFTYYFLTMLVIEATIGKAYIYSLTNIIALTLMVISFLSAASEWEPEFRRYIERKFSGMIVNRLNSIIDILPSIIRPILILFIILILSLFDFLIGLTENFEISKKISANLFKKQIEQIEAEDGSGEMIPATYKEKFSYQSLSDNDHYVSFDQVFEDAISNEITEWLEGKSDEHSLVVYGDKGVGKTTLLKHITGPFQSSELGQVENLKADITYTKMPSKTLTKNDLRSFLLSIFNSTQSSDTFNIEAIDQTLENKTIIVIDEAQNSFLAKPDGFAAYHDFVTQINKNTKNIFWVISFNKYSWLYLDRAFGRTQFFRNTFEVKGWSDVSIKELIMKRHESSSYKLSYDLLISATKSQDEIDKYSSVESKFFKLLWELSHGNPRTALHLWLTALSRKNARVFNVNIPKEVDIGQLEILSDDLMFTLSTILKHENLTQSEIVKTTDFGRGIVGNAIKVGIERKFIYHDERGRYLIDIVSQYYLIKYLRLKNFLYGK